MSVPNGYWILALSLDDGKCSLLGYKDEEHSKREIRRAYKKFKGDGDVAGAVSIPAERFFSTKQEMISYFK